MVVGKKPFSLIYFAFIYVEMLSQPHKTHSEKGKLVKEECMYSQDVFHMGCSGKRSAYY